MKLTHASPEEVARRLACWDGPISRRSERWRDVMRFHGGLVGHIRSSGEWANAPKVKNVRVVALRTSTGTVVRWANSGGLRHDDLVGYVGDDLTCVKSGYVDLGEDELVVQGYRESDDG
jgi:hypothetical protein